MGALFVEVTSSGLKTADAAIVTRACLLHAVELIPAAAASTLVLHDNSGAASGLELAKLSAIANGESVYMTFDNPVRASEGIYANVEGASAAYIVYYSLS